MLPPLFIGQIVETISAALQSAGVSDGVVAVLGRPRVARALSERGHRVLDLAEKRKSLRRSRGDRVYGQFDRLPLSSAGLAALVAFDVGQRGDWATRLAEWSRVVHPHGAIVLVDRTTPSELTRRALCGGLMEIEQRQTGGTFVTSGIVDELAVDSATG